MFCNLIKINDLGFYLAEHVFSLLTLIFLFLYLLWLFLRRWSSKDRFHIFASFLLSWDFFWGVVFVSLKIFLFFSNELFSFDCFCFWVDLFELLESEVWICICWSSLLFLLKLLLPFFFLFLEHCISLSL